ncbi:transmembrane protein 39A isoform X1 [Parasteatoda tepidariorum]|uniref:transmembrane protein 39A isoform X1 n=1 Tax=Parasteatoda tepidariorum TaxID=114398 RepID=UPI001C726189|nr:transmembrane protein 39A [Parasteatoda tepidariorum]
MAGGRRNAKSSSFNKHQAHASDDRHTDLPTQPQVIPPKHIPLPDLSPSSDLLFEVDALVLSLCAIAGQYVNLYRSVFWLPYSHTDFALNYYLIDPYLLAFCLIMVARRFPIYLLKQMCVVCLPASYHSSCTICFQILTGIVIAPALLFCSYNIIKQHGTLSMLFLVYPFALFFIGLGTKVIKFLELISIPQERQTGARSKHASSVKHQSITHVCSMSADTIREEVDTLKNDFNFRMKQVLFNTFLVVYHASFLPCYFAQPELQYDFFWVTQYGIFTGISTFVMHVSHIFPPRYCDVLHRAALHLGRWQKVELKNVHVPYSIWTESATWNQGALVKHSKELFKAEGISNAAEPGHSGHSRFYILFKNPTFLMRIMFVIQVLLMFILIFVLCQSYTWNELLSIQLLILINCKTLYSVTKVYFVIKKIYHEEKVLISKFCN